MSQPPSAISHVTGRGLPLRGDEVNDWLTIAATGGPIAPLSLLGREM